MSRPMAMQGATRDTPAKVGVIAELGVNHDGSPDRATRLIAAAAEAGADAVKLQFFDPDRLLSADSELAGYQKGKAADAKALLRGLTLTPGQVKTLGDAARGAGLSLVVTLFSPGDAAVLAELGVEIDAVKTASPDAVNPAVLEAAASLGAALLISTGTCDLAELEPAADVLRGRGAGEGPGGLAGAMLQCVSSYPTPMDRAALGGLVAMREALGVAVGYSDHTPGLHTGALAVAAGAVVLEKHLTHDRAAPGPDHATSLDPGQFAEYVAHVRQAQAMLGPISKTALDIEADVRRVSRQSVCAVRDLPAGRVLTAEDVTVKRPGTGLPAARLADVIGRTLARPVAADRLLREDDLVG